MLKKLNWCVCILAIVLSVLSLGTLVGGDLGLLLAMAVLPKTVTAGVCVSAVLWIVAWWQRNDAAARPAMIAVACFAVCTLIWLSHASRLAGLVL